jgi:predicted metal-dependent hydrolase
VKPTICAIAYAEAVRLEWQSGPLAAGLHCYQNEEFFEAHEHWECVWLELVEPEKSFLQALIQVSAAFHHQRAGNFAGAASLLRKSLRRLERCPACFGGIAVEPLRCEIRPWLHALENAPASSCPAASPRIRPLDQSIQ